LKEQDDNHMNLHEEDEAKYSQLKEDLGKKEQEID